MNQEYKLTVRGCCYLIDEINFNPRMAAADWCSGVFLTDVRVLSRTFFQSIVDPKEAYSLLVPEYR